MPFVAMLVSALVLSLGLPDPGPQDLRMYAVDPVSSELYVVVHRAGLLSFLGHEHAVVPTEWSAELCLEDPIPAGAHGSVVMQTSTLVIDSDSARALAGMGGGPGEDDRREIQGRMLDSEYLAAEEFPEIRLEVVAGAPEGGDSVPVEGSITLRGQTRPIELPVRVERGENGAVTLHGMLRIHQRDFGIEPESTAGLVKVSNDVDLHFALSATPTEAVCAPR